jgi:hypothetical protein
MQDVLKALNKLVADQVIGQYAIGGAVGAAFYIRASQTEDVDAFVVLPHHSSGLILLSPIYDALTAMGGIVEGEHIRFGNWPLQILTDANKLIAEAIQNALSTEYEGVPTRVFRPEHLCAVALQVGRAKDLLRVKMFLEQDVVNLDRLSALLDKYGLTMPT